MSYLIKCRVVAGRIAEDHEVVMELKSPSAGHLKIGHGVYCLPVGGGILSAKLMIAAAWVSEHGAPQAITVDGTDVRVQVSAQAFQDVFESYLDDGDVRLDVREMKDVTPGSMFLISAPCNCWDMSITIYAVGARQEFYLIRDEFLSPTPNLD